MSYGCYDFLHERSWQVPKGHVKYVLRETGPRNQGHNLGDYNMF